MEAFEKELRHLINRHSIENVADMPDFLLARMICGMIEAMGPSIKKTLDWHGCNSVCHPAAAPIVEILEGAGYKTVTEAEDVLAGPVAPGMSCNGCGHLAPSGACRTHPLSSVPCWPCNEFSAAADGRQKAKFVRIKLHGGGTYVQPVSELANALEGELDGVEIGQAAVIEFTPVEMTQHEYDRLPAFSGH
jgi:hypothetical protein